MNKQTRDRIANLRKEITEIAVSIENYRRQKTEIEERKEALYRTYLRDEYSIDEYKNELRKAFGDREGTEWLSEYSRRTADSYSRIGELEKRIKDAEAEKEKPRYTAIFAVLFLAIGLFATLYATGILRPAVTGFAAFNGTAENITENITNITAPAAENISANITENATAPETNITENITPENITANLSELNISLPNITENLTENITENAILPENLSENISDNITANITENITNATNITLPENITQNITENITANITENITMPENVTIPENISANITENITANVTANLPPVLIAQIPAITMQIGESREIALSNYFTDPEGKQLTYLAIGADGLTIEVSSDTAIITANATGNYSIWFAASDLENITYSNIVNLEVMPKANMPTSCTITPILLIGTDKVSINLSEHCSDEDSSNITYALTNAVNVNATVEGEILAVWTDELFSGLGYVSFTATEGNLTTKFTVLVEAFEKGVRVLSQEFVQSKAEIGKPVEWTHHIVIEKLDNRTEDIEITLPNDARNIIIYKKYGQTDIQVTDATVNTNGSVQNVEQFNSGPTALQVTGQAITGNAVRITQGSGKLAERFINWLIGIFRQIGRITGFAVAEPNVTTENITAPTVENISANITENATAPETNITENITAENLTQNISENITANITENLTQNITENATMPENVIIPENISANIIENATENATYENITIPENLTSQIIENITPVIVPPAEIGNNMTLAIPESDMQSEYTITFTTPAPEKTEGIAESNERYWSKNITISSDAQIHYINTTAYTSIIESRAEQVKLFWLANGTRIDVTHDERFGVTLEDTNNNTLIDRVSWIVPRLSNESFEVQVDITIITLQSYPMVGGNWTTEFNTTGTANLTISAMNGTTYTKEPNDNNETENDLRFLQIACGNSTLPGDSIRAILNASCMNGTVENTTLSCAGEDSAYVNYTQLMDSNLSLPVLSIFMENYSCNSTAYYTVHVLTAGKHTQEFRFGDKIAYAYNMAGLPVVTLEKPVNNSIVHTGVLLNFTITGQNASWYSINSSANMTLNSPYDIDTTGWSNNTVYNVTIYANNSLGDVGTYIYTFNFNNSAYGHFEPYYVWPYEDFGNTTVPYLKFFTFNAGVRCVGGPCGDINATLDPAEINRMVEEAIKRQIEYYVNEQMRNGNSIKNLKMTIEGMVIAESGADNVSYTVSTKVEER
ncbi:MAG: hypothetical protein NTZ02_04685 [Candidatus Woesearchaeota archaeon]|nr:hypothetical protein [Candidatus Woesearchaeota archaeon]